MKKILIFFISVLLLAGYLSAAICFNLVTPYGNHVIIASGLSQKDSFIKTLTSNPIDLSYTPIFSKIYISFYGVQCDFSYVDKPIIAKDKNASLSYIISLFAEKHLTKGTIKKDYTYNLLVKTVEKCGINHSFEGIPPLIEAIITKNSLILDELLQLGADPYLTINKPGKKIHGMNAIDFVKRLIEKKSIKPKDKAIYAEMLAIIDGYIKQQPNSKN